MKKTIAFIMMFMAIILILNGCTEARFEDKINYKVIETTKSNVETVAATVIETEPTTEKVTEPEVTIDKNKKMIAFTFDDGPCSNTEKILNIFKKYGGKATFFVVGNRLENNSKILKKIIKEGHEVGSHTWDHTNLSNLNKNGIINDFTKMKDKISEITGYEINLLRPPYGAYNDTVKSVCKNNNIPIIMWDVDTLDWSSRDKDSVSKVIMDEAQDGSIVLCHDLYDSTVDAIEAVIPKFVKQGYQLVTVSDMLKADTGSIEPGLGYFSRNESY